MIKIKIRVKTEANTYIHTEYVDDNYIISKLNEDLKMLVEKVCKDSHLENIEDVIITAIFDW